MAKDYSQMTDAELQAEFAAQSGRSGQPTQIFSPRPKPEGRPTPQTPAQLYADRIAKDKFASDLYSQYTRRGPVQEYEVSLPALVAVMDAKSGSDDLALTYAAAKIWDPGSVVRGEEQNNVAEAISNVRDRMLKSFSREFYDPETATFTQAGRNKLFATLKKKLDAQRIAYNAVRNDYVKKAKAADIDVDLVVGTDFNATYAPQLQTFNKQFGDTGAAKSEPKVPVVQSPSGTPSSDLQGYRFSPQASAQIISYIQSPNFTKEGYADLMARVAVQEGIATPENVAPYREFSLGEGERLAKLNQQTRSAISGFDYSKVDAQATKNAGLIDAATQAVKNVPASAYNLMAGIAALPIDVVRSVVSQTPQGTTKTTIDLVKDLASAAGVGETDGKTLAAVGDALQERYGSLENIKRTMITDPVGFAGDVSLISTAAGATMKVAGLTRPGQITSAVGSKLDPLSFLVESVRGTAPSVREAIRTRAPSLPMVGETARDLTASAVGFPSGIGGETVSALYQAGRTRPIGAAPTAPYEAAVAGMREPESVTRKTVDLATQSVRNLRNLASEQYKAARREFGTQAQPINFDDVRQTIQELRPEDYGTFSRKNMPASHKAWETMRDMVEEKAEAIRKNPAEADPLSIDLFKKRLYERGSKVGNQFDSDAARIARDAYQGVRQKLVEADPLYEQMMKNYEDAQDELFQLESTFSLGGKQVRTDTANRKLLSIMRNDANTNYGERMSRGMRLAQLDPTGQLVPMIAGQMASSFTPRGLGGAGLGVGYGASTLFGVPLSPSAILGVPSMMPRVVGEAALGAGRVAGSLPSLSRLVETYSKTPALRVSALGGAQYGAGAQNVEQDLINADLTSILGPIGGR